MCMTDMNSMQAAEALGVTPREVRRLAANGRLQGVRHVGRTLVLDAESVQRLVQERRRRGRPWTERISWAALAILSGEEASWISPVERTRLLHRLRRTDSVDLTYLATRRALVRRFGGRLSSLDDLAPYVVPTATSVLDDAQFRRWGLTRAQKALDGYVPDGEVDALAARFGLVEDVAGNVTLRSVTFEGAFVGGRTPRAAVALDLVDSLNTRERSAGLRVLGGLCEEVIAGGR